MLLEAEGFWELERICKRGGEELCGEVEKRVNNDLNEVCVGGVMSVFRHLISLRQN